MKEAYHAIPVVYVLLFLARLPSCQFTPNFHSTAMIPSFRLSPRFLLPKICRGSKELTTTGNARHLSGVTATQL